MKKKTQTKKKIIKAVKPKKEPEEQENFLFKLDSYYVSTNPRNYILKRAGDYRYFPRLDQALWYIYSQEQKTKLKNSDLEQICKKIETLQERFLDKLAKLGLKTLK
jgi:hypothetical protein